MLFLSQESQKLHDSYHDDMRTLYRIYARHARLLGAWAAEKLFLFGDKGNDYAVGMVDTDHSDDADNRGRAVYEKIKSDCIKNDIIFDEAEFLKIYNDIFIQAHSQIISQLDMYQ